MGNAVEKNGITFEQVKDTWQVLDYNYEMDLGVIVLHEGPGWIFKPVSGVFLDVGQLRTLYDFVRELPVPS